MEHQMSSSSENNENFLVSSVEEGINLIIHRAPKALLGGRETLFFNMKRRGKRNFVLITT